MTRTYFRRPPRTAALLLLFFYLAVSVFTVEATRFRAEKEHAGLMRAAAEKTEACFAVLRDARVAAGYPIDPLADPNSTGMIGMEFTGITTSLGNLESKRSTANPNCAAMITDFLVQCGVGAGDTVCLNLSGSFPSLNVAALCALDTLDARGIVINSIGASSYGANLPEFAYPDMEHVLLERGLIANHTRWCSLGGSRDAGIDMLEPELARAAAERAAANGVELISAGSAEESLLIREELYTRESGGLENVRCFINIGGNVFAFAGGDSLIDAPNGVIRAPFRNMEHRGLIPWFLDRGIPVIHLLEMRSLLTAAGLPFDPVPMPKAGEGDVYYELRFRAPIVIGAFLGFLLLFVLLAVRSAGKESSLRDQ